MTRMARIIRRLMRLDTGRLLRVSAVLTMVALGLMLWSMFAPTPLPIILAMSLGQALGTLAFLLYGVCIAQDLWKIRRTRRESSQNLPIIREESKP